MIFVFDLDDTLCDTDGYSEYYIRKFFEEHKYPYKQIATDVRFAEAKFNWTTEQALVWYKEFGDQMMLEFPIKDGVKEMLNYLKEKGHTIILSTARADDWHTAPVEITMKWLENNGLVFDKIYIGRNDKEEICKQENADVFVDDDIKIISRVSTLWANQKDKHVFLSNTNYNKTLTIPEDITRINSIKELETILN